MTTAKPLTNDNDAYISIYGHATSGHSIQLTNCFFRSSSSSMADVSPTKYHVNSGLIGDIPEVGSMFFCSKGALHLQSLSFFSQPTMPRSTRPTKNAIEISHEGDDAVDLWKREDIAVGIVSGLSSRFEATDASVTVKIKPFISFKSDTPTESSIVARELQIASDAIMICSGVPLPRKHLIFQPVGTRRGQVEEVGKENIDDSLREGPDFHDALLDLPAIRTNAPGLFQSFRDQWENLSPALRILTSTMRRKPPYVEERFITLTQAVEAFCSIVQGDENYVDSEDWEAILKQLRDTADSVSEGDHRRSLRSRLQYLNRWSLRKRIVVLLKSLPSDLQQVLFNGDFSYADRIVNLRNSLVHPRPERCKEHRLLAHASPRLSLLLRISMLHSVLPAEIDRTFLGSALRQNRFAAHALEQPF